MLDMWKSRSAQEAIQSLSRDDILIANPKGKDVCLNVIASLDERVRRFVFSSFLRRSIDTTHDDNHIASTSEISIP